MHIEYFKLHPEAKVISQPCAAIVNYAEKHKPEMLPHFRSGNGQLRSINVETFLKSSGDRVECSVFKDLKLEDFLREYVDRCQTQLPTELELDEVYRSMGKITEMDRHIELRSFVIYAVRRSIVSRKNCHCHILAALE